MGDRVSISFRNGDKESVTLFHLWGGRAFVREAQRYADELRTWRDKRMATGLVAVCLANRLDRLEVNTVMVDFIRHMTSDLARVNTDLYLGATPKDGDNSDYGHFVSFLDSKETEGSKQ